MTTTSPAALAAALDDRFRGQCARLDADQPWVGRLVLQGETRNFEYFIGSRRIVDERIVDWRHPIGRSFYELVPGDAFALDAPGYVQLEGTIESRCATKAAERRLREVDLTTVSQHVVLVAGDDGFVDRDAVPARRMPQEGLDDILGLLTPAQYRLITSSRGRPLIVQGRAGSGKTSVALYRVSWLTWADPDATEAPIDPSRVLMVMFNKALSTFVRGTLDRLSLSGVQLDTFHGWALEAVKRAYRGVIDMDTKSHPGHREAEALKKQLGILRATDAFVARQSRALDAWLEAKLAPYDRAGEWMARFRASEAPVARRIALLRSEALRARDGAATTRDEKRLTAVHVVFTRAMERFTRYKEELLRLLTDRDLLVEHLPGASPADIDAMIAYQKELQWEGGDERRPGSKISFADLAILLRLLQLKHGGLPDKDHEDEVRVFDHLVIDEAQDFGAVELTVLLAAVRSRTGVTIVGDTNQKIVPEADFIGWDALARELGVEGASVAKLEVPHRSTSAIMAVADVVVGDQSPAGRPGPRPTMTVVEAGQVVNRVAALVRASVAENPAAHVAVVCAKAGQVDGYVEALQAALPELGASVRVGRNKDFSFGAGVSVTNLRQVKGLEFDVVIGLDPTDTHYPNREQGKRWLYTLVTRAKDALHFVGTEPAGGLLQAAIDKGLVELTDLTEVTPVQFGPEDEEPF